MYLYRRSQLVHRPVEAEGRLRALEPRGVHDCSHSPFRYNNHLYHTLTCRSSELGKSVCLHYLTSGSMLGRVEVVLNLGWAHVE